MHLDKEMSKFKPQKSITYVLIKSIASVKKLFSWFPFFNQKKPMWMVIVMIHLLHIKWSSQSLKFSKKFSKRCSLFLRNVLSKLRDFLNWWKWKRILEDVKSKPKKIVDKMLLWLPSKLRKKADRMPLVKVSLHI